MKFARPRLCRKNFSGKNGKYGNLSVISNVRFVGGDGNIPADMFVTVVDDIVVVSSGRIPLADGVSIGSTKGGFLRNDKNKCRHKSSGISELSTSNSRNCRKPW